MADELPKAVGYDEAVQSQKDAAAEEAPVAIEILPTKVIAVDPHTPGVSKVVAPLPSPHPRFWYDENASDADRKAQEIAINEANGSTPAVADARIAKENEKLDSDKDAKYDG